MAESNRLACRLQTPLSKPEMSCSKVVEFESSSSSEEEPVPLDDAEYMKPWYVAKSEDTRPHPAKWKALA
eukprot:317077-Amphidinium_carterae.1